MHILHYVDSNYSFASSLWMSVVYIVSSPLGSRWDDFCVISQAGGQLLNFKNQVGDTFRGLKMILGSQAGGDCFIMTNLVFPQNASPFILQISPAALSYIFERLLNMITFTMYMLLYLIFKDKYVKIFKDRYFI